MINEISIVKHNQTQADYERYLRIHPNGRPEGIHLKGSDLYMNFVKGYPCRDPSAILAAVCQFCWEGSAPYIEPDPDAYCDYLSSKSYKSTRGIEIAKLVRPHLKDLTPVRFCHGDLTMHNTIMSLDHRIILLDPGDCHGLPCAELDVAKLMVSAQDQMSCVFFGVQPATGCMSKFDKCLIALKLSHYWRMLPYFKTGFRNTFILQQIESHVNLLS